MPEITFTIPSPINASVQVGDTAHYIKINAVSGGFTTHTENTQLVTLGTIRSITPQYTQGAVVASPQTDTSSELMGNDTTMDENIDSYQIQFLHLYSYSQFFLLMLYLHLLLEKLFLCLVHLS